MFAYLKTFMPRSLYGRAALILIVPIVTIQLVVSVAFIQRHFERVTRQMTEGVAIELRYLEAEVEAATAETAAARGGGLARDLQMQVALPADWSAQH